MTGNDLCVNKPVTVPVIFEPPCTYTGTGSRYTHCVHGLATGLPKVTHRYNNFCNLKIHLQYFEMLLLSMSYYNVALFLNIAKQSGAFVPTRIN